MATSLSGATSRSIPSAVTPERISGWGSKLVAAERALLAPTPAEDAVGNSIADVSIEVGAAADRMGSSLATRGAAGVLTGVSELLGTTASIVLSDANAAIWNLRDAGGQLQQIARSLTDHDRGGAASGGARSL